MADPSSAIKNVGSPMPVHAQDATLPPAMAAAPIGLLDRVSASRTAWPAFDFANEARDPPLVNSDVPASVPASAPISAAAPISTPASAPAAAPAPISPAAAPTSAPASAPADAPMPALAPAVTIATNAAVNGLD